MSNANGFELNIPLLPKPLHIMFNFGNLKISFTNLLLHSPLKNTGYKGADCQFGSINVPCPLSASIV